ncbi:hypothetical protein [Larkinella ripae]
MGPEWYLRWAATGSILFLLFLPLPKVSAQDSARLWRRPNGLKTNLIAPFSLFYERALTQRFALQGSIRWLRYRNPHPENFVNVAVEGRLYLDNRNWLRSKGHPAGFYVSPYLKARRLQLINEIGYGFNKVGDLDEVIIRSIGCGVTVGHQWVARRGFTGDLFVGAGALPQTLSEYRHTQRYGTVRSTSGFEFHSIDLRIGICLGWAFR